MIAQKLSENRNKIIRYSFITFGVILLLFTLLFNACYWAIETSSGYLQLNGENKEQNATALVLLSVFIPLFSAIVCLLISGYFRSYTKADAIRQLETQFRNGFIDDEHYRQQLLHIERFELEKEKMKKEIEIERKEALSQIEIEKSKAEKAMRQKAKKVKEQLEKDIDANE